MGVCRTEKKRVVGWYGKRLRRDGMAAVDGDLRFQVSARAKGAPLAGDDHHPCWGLPVSDETRPGEMGTYQRLGSSSNQRRTEVRSLLSWGETALRYLGRFRVRRRTCSWGKETLRSSECEGTCAAKVMITAVCCDPKREARAQSELAMTKQDTHDKHRR